MSEPPLVIRGARVYDGTGAPPIEADVALRGDRIERVGNVPGSGAEIDATGLALAPGFIDVHTHDDFAALVHPDMGFKVCGGVTTCVVGNCGFGAAPHREASLMARVFHPRAELPEWEGYRGYVSHLAAHPPSVNVGFLVGHGTARLAAMQGNEARPPTGSEMDRMKAVLREGLEAGALGLSTGLIYEPGRFATTDEIAELAAEMRGSGALYATHMRNEAVGLLDSVEETLAIGERAGVPVQISHHKAAGREAWGLVRESLRRIEAAQARGVDVHADQYPYTAASTVLAAVVRGGGLAQATAEMGAPSGDEVIVASTASHPEWEGRSIAELAREFGVSAQETGERVLAEEPIATCIIDLMDEDDVRRVMRHPSTMIGSDGIPTLDGKPHPRLYGSFARVLGRYARDQKLFPLEEAVHRMTGLSAHKFRLAERGVVREGAFADLVVFDPERILDVGTFQDPKLPPVGIAHVFVNGAAVVRDGRHTGERPGRPLRRARAA